MNTPHPHKNLIIAWANCPETVFQFRGAGHSANCWFDMKHPDWSHREVRIKPKPPVYEYQVVFEYKNWKSGHRISSEWFTNASEFEQFYGDDTNFISLYEPTKRIRVTEEES